MWIVIAILFILSVALFPFVARVVARQRMLTRLCQDIHRAGGKVRRLCRFPALSRNRASSYDLLVRVGNVQYAVKLWTPLYRGAELRVDRDGRVRELRTVGAPLNPHGLRRTHTVCGLRHAVPATKLGARASHCGRVLLVYPSYRRVLFREEKGWRTLRDGDVIFDKQLLSPSALLARIRTEGNTEETR